MCQCQGGQRGSVLVLVMVTLLILSLLLREMALVAVQDDALRLEFCGRMGELGEVTPTGVRGGAEPLSASG